MTVTNEKSGRGFLKHFVRLSSYLFPSFHGLKVAEAEKKKRFLPFFPFLPFSMPSDDENSVD
jgi:hypothetical protein